MSLFGYEKYKGVKCAVAHIKYTNFNTANTIWVDVKNGFTLKTISETESVYGKRGTVRESIVTLNKVTDADIQRPDLTGYTQLKAVYESEIINKNKANENGYSPANPSSIEINGQELLVDSLRFIEDNNL